MYAVFCPATLALYCVSCISVYILCDVTSVLVYILNALLSEVLVISSSLQSPNISAISPALPFVPLLDAVPVALSTTDFVLPSHFSILPVYICVVISADHLIFWLVPIVLADTRLPFASVVLTPHVSRPLTPGKISPIIHLPVSRPVYTENLPGIVILVSASLSAVPYGAPGPPSKHENISSPGLSGSISVT